MGRKHTKKKHRTKHHKKKHGMNGRKFARTAKKIGIGAIRDTGRLGMGFLKIGSRIPGQMIHDSRLLGKKIHKKIRRITKRRRGGTRSKRRRGGSCSKRRRGGTRSKCRR
jgi:hypothetical protein|tara:strand:+ start:2313 stop:2642 length:330 start_codon:yes stop_codon:yes gene_type:complete